MFGKSGQLIEQTEMNLNKIDNRLEWKIGWIFGNFNSTVTRLITLVIGKGPMHVGPNFLDSCLDCRNLVERYTSSPVLKSF